MEYKFRCWLRSVCDDFALRKPNSTEINVVHHIHVLFSLSLPENYYMIQIELNLFRSRFKCLWFNVELWQLLLCLRGRAAGSGDWTSKVIAGQAFTLVVVFVVFNFEQSVLYRKRCDRDVIYMMHMMNICSCTSEKLCIYFQRRYGRPSMAMMNDQMNGKPNLH